MADLEGKPKDVLEDLTWKILSATDSDDIRGYVIQAAAHGVELGRAETAATPDLSWIVRATERIAKLQPGTNDGVIAMIIREEWAMGTQ